MKTLLRVLLAAVACAAPARAAAQPLHLVLPPSQTRPALLAAGEGFGRALGRLYGAPVRVTVASDYAAVIEALRNRTADLAFVHPVGYVLASREAKARIVARNLWHGKSTFTSRIYVRKDGGIKTLEDLRGKTMAFVDPSSSSGYTYPMVLLIQRGLVKNRDPKTFFREVDDDRGRGPARRPAARRRRRRRRRSRDPPRRVRRDPRPQRRRQDHVPARAQSPGRADRGGRARRRPRGHRRRPRDAAGAAPADRDGVSAVQPRAARLGTRQRPGRPPRLGAGAADAVRTLPCRGSPDRPGVPRPGRARRLRPAPRRHAVRRRAAARCHRPRARAVARGDPGRRADGQSRPRAHGQHHGPAEDDPGPARPHAGREPAPARDRAGLCDARRRLPPGPRRVRRAAGRALTLGCA